MSQDCQSWTEENKNRKSAVESERAGKGKTIKPNHCTGKIGKTRVYP